VQVRLIGFVAQRAVALLVCKRSLNDKNFNDH